MSDDPNLTDTCFYVQDGPPNEWWTSPDIGILDPNLPEIDPQTGLYNFIYDALKPNFPYKWMVSVNRSAQCATVPAGTVLVAELWAANPALVMTPQNSVKIGSVESSNIPDPGSSHWIFPDVANYWAPSTDASSPDGPGHKCLIARGYPQGQTPDVEDFHCPDDPHLAQHNITILSADFGESLRFKVNTMRLPSSRDHTATLRAALITVPARRLLHRLRPSLARYGHRRLAASPPRKLALDLPKDMKAKPVEVPSEKTPAVAYEALAQLEPGRQYDFYLTADLSNAQRGETYVFDVTQHDARGKLEGGLTVVAVLV